MPATVSWQAGSLTPVSVTFQNVTATRFRAMIGRYAKRHALIQEGMTETQIGEAAIRHYMARFAEESADTQRADLITANAATIESVIVADNSL